MYILETPEATEAVNKILVAQRPVMSNYDWDNLDYWLCHSKESFHGRQVKGEMFLFEDHRIPDGTKVPLSILRIDA